MQTLVLHVEGMSCSHCLNAVNQALARLEGVRVESVQVGRARVEYDPEVVTPAAVAAAVTAAGYRASPGGGGSGRD